MIFGLDNFENLAPLGHGSIDAGGIVATAVKQHHAVVRCRFQVLQHAVEIESTRFRVVITVSRDVRVVAILEDHVVIAPCGLGSENRVDAGESSEKLGADAQTSGPAQRLK